VVHIVCNAHVQVIEEQLSHSIHLPVQLHLQEAKNFLRKTRDLGMAYHTPPLKKQGEMQNAVT